MLRDRKCIACRQTKNQYEMLRIAKINDELQLDLTYKLGGRGAYVCKNSNCINQVIKKRILNRAFKRDVGADIYSKLGEYEQNS